MFWTVYLSIFGAPQYSPRLLKWQRMAAAIPLLLAFSGVVLSAQESLKLTQLNHTSWTAREGAPSEIAGLAQGPDGVLWVAGGGGLFRFDGNTFTLFQPASGERPLPGISATALGMARDGTIWVAFRPTGVVAIKNDHVRAYDSKDGLPPNTVTQLLEGPDGTMWAIVQARLMHLHADRWWNESATSQVESERVSKMFFDREGTQWVATNKRIYRRSHGQRELQATGEPGGQIIQFAESPDGSLWIAGAEEDSSTGWVRQLNVERHSVANPAKISVQPDDMLFDRQGALWVAAENGALMIPPDAQRSQQQISIERVGRTDGLSSDSATRLAQDASGDVWVGTMRGLDRFKQPKLISPQGVPVSDRRMILSSCRNGDVWIGVPASPLVSIEGSRPVNHIVESKEITSLYCDQQGAIWFTDDAGIGRYDVKQLASIPIPAGLQSGSAKQVLRAPDGSIVATFRNGGGLWRWNGAWQKILSPVFPNGAPLVIFQDRRNTIWIGYANGTIGTLEGAVAHTFQSPGLGQVTAFAETTYGFLAAGMNGIALFNGTGFKYLPFRDANHVRGISGMVEASDEDLWLNGAYGVVRVPRTEIPKAVASQYYKMNAEIITEGNVVGPAPLSYALPTAVAGSNGRIWFTSTSKAVYVDPDHFPRNTIPPVLTITSVSADGRTLPDYRRIAAGVNTLIINYAGLNVTAPERVSYQYRLDGNDTSWQEVGNRTEAIYTRLRPGKYTFHVLASNGEGASSEMSSQQFTILPALYETLWFRMLCVTMVFALLWTTVFLRVRAASERLRIRAEERADERVRIARDLHDTLLQSVQGLMLRFHVAAQEVPKDSRARSKLEQALGAADSVLLEGRERVKNLRTNTLNDLSLSEALENVGATFAHQNHAVFVVLTEGTAMPIVPIVAEEMFCIGREAIVNAFHHAGAAHITMTVTYGKSDLRLSCSDDGSGIPADILAAYRREGHWGLVGMRERAAKIRAVFECQSSSATGTTVTASIAARLAYSKAGKPSDIFVNYRHLLGF